MTRRRSTSAAGEPDEPSREGSPDATSPVRRDAIWKSVLGATGGWGCERATFYREVVRDDRGYRLSFGADEPIIFGIAVDAAHNLLMDHRAEHGPVDASMVGTDLSDEGIGEPLLIEEVVALAAAAVRQGMGVARGRSLARPWTSDDWDVLAGRVTLAVEKLLGLWPNRTTARGEPEPEPEGTPAGPPIGWLDVAGLMVQPQRRLYTPGVVGGRGISGRPDYVLTSSGIIVAWVDVKALSRSGSYPAKWAAGEAVAYDYMVAVENHGVLPDWHGYLEYRRVQKPYWALITASVHPSVTGLAEAYFRRWEIALDMDDPDVLSFNPQSCAKCDYREPLPGHAGCPIGAAVLDVAPGDDAAMD